MNVFLLYGNKVVLVLPVPIFILKRTRVMNY